MKRGEKKRLDFVQRNGRTRKEEKVGYMDIVEEGEGKCSLYFYGDIVSSKWECWYDEMCPQDIADFLNELEGHEELDVYFNSAGGSVFGGLAIYNQLKRFGGHKVGHVDGMAASIASVIMFACDELYFATGALAMIHKPSCYGYGNADDLAKVIEQLDKCEDSILDVYEQHAKDGVTREDIKEKMAAETWFSGEELAEMFDIELEDCEPTAACESVYFDKYVNAPAQLKTAKADDAGEDKNRRQGVGNHAAGQPRSGRGQQDAGDGLADIVPGIVDAVIEEMAKREKAKIDDEKEDILADLDFYGV